MAHDVAVAEVEPDLREFGRVETLAGAKRRAHQGRRLGVFGYAVELDAVAGVDGVF